MQQRTAEWFQARLGKVTASNISSIINKTAKGLPTSKYEEYKFQLITERLMGKTVSSYETPAMRWGNEHEDSAIEEYSFLYDTPVTRCGFIPHPTIEMAGASPDGLIGDEGLIEVKCPQPITHTRFLLSGEIKPEYILQMQFQMACTGRKWCDFVSYHPWFIDESPHLCIKVIRIPRDDEQIEHINKAVEAFLAEIEQEMQILTKAA
ncbi:lambda exonuclease family protein [Bartonella schoenbuchensis]|uniref:Exodeoxyribonuclease (Lambda-induced) n=1 Tax=Bartonella schoenbuchensis (strain DSM 13525 / NCTC 13165 / R1) TaxID=687861 RepID=E6Z094_BARSR|nr:lambda exonuclease family protein [Bartonella schoenbuchensis]AQX31002.1 exodeoxyribonuclease (lambda-induced) [Bartonella schoenbuchensis R1]CBI82532.1 phage-related exonuclease [Bartonella schoenbuchensis R1]